MTAAEYLEWERSQRDRHQLLRGEVYAMAGGSPRHNLVCANVLARLHAALRGGSCRPFTSDQKIHIPASGDFVYADAIVICGNVELHAGTPDVVVNPRIVVEVLSKSTEHHDRDDKWEDYRGIPTLTDYVLVSQRSARVEHFARDADGSWRYRVVSAGGRLELTTGTELFIDEVYEGAFEVPGDA